MIAALLLCAGQSQRFGASDKQLHSVSINANTKAMALHSADSLASALPQPHSNVQHAQQPFKSTAVHCIINPQQTALQTLLKQHGYTPLINPQAHRGMGSSIATGITALLSQSPKIDTWLIALGDMPYINADSLQHLIQQQPNDKDTPFIIRPYRERMSDAAHSAEKPQATNKQWGHPVLFSHHFSAELAQLNECNGAHAIIERHPQHLFGVAINHMGHYHDVDRLNDVEPE